MYPTAQQAAEHCGDAILQLLKESLSGESLATLAISGGSTPRPMFEHMARSRFDWSAVHLFWVDERCVPPADPQSNYRLAKETLIEPAHIPSANVKRIPAEEPDLEAVATQYENRLPHALDLIVVGIGEDGHTAAIFPGSPAASEAVRRVVPVLDSPKPPAQRVTITPRVLREAREVLMLATGEEKAEAVWRALKSETDPTDVPARLVREREWLIDEEASSWHTAPEGG